MQTVRVAKVFLENSDGTILILRRSKTAPRRALEWDLPGGWVEPDENPLDAAIRELAEEAGVQLAVVTEALKTTDVRDDEAVIRHYAIGLADNPSISLSYEHDKYRWVTKAAFADVMQYPPHVQAFQAIYS